MTPPIAIRVLLAGRLVASTMFAKHHAVCLVESMDNESAATWRPSGSAGLTKAFSAADSTGQRISGYQVGVVFKF